MVNIATPRRHKYNAQETIVDTITFASKLEARRYCQLKLLLASGVISDLDIQPVFELQPSFIDCTGTKRRAIKYKADFQYIENGKVIIEEVKGYESALWKVKKKMFLYHHSGLELRILEKEDIG